MAEKGVVPGDIFPLRRMIGSVPPETQVVLWGESHENLFHRQLLYLNLPDFAQAGYRFGFENMACANAGTKTMLAHLGYRPYHFQRYPHVAFPNGHNVFPSESAEEFGENYNHFSQIHGAASEYKLLKGAARLGMDPRFVDMPLTDMEYSLTHDGMTQRNAYMADAIADSCGNDGKMLVCCGSLHTFGVGGNKKLCGCQQSLQDMLSEKGLKTYTFTSLSEPEDLLVEGSQTDEAGDPSAGDFIKHNDSVAAILLDDLFVESSLEFATRTFPINLHDISARAGKSIPDELVVFPDRSLDFLLAEKSRTMYLINPVFEAQAWDKIWQGAGRAAHREYKAQRKASPPSP